MKSFFVKGPLKSKNKIHGVVIAIIFICFGTALLGQSPNQSTNSEANDSDALRDVSDAKVVFDINSNDPNSLAIYLQIIETTYDDLNKQHVKPDIILTFRGTAVSFISTDRQRFEADQIKAMDQIVERISNLHEKGVKMEACAIAMRWQKIEKDKLLVGIKTVGNTFVSLAGYQMKGYGVIPIY